MKNAIYYRIVNSKNEVVFGPVASLYNATEHSTYRSFVENTMNVANSDLINMHDKEVESGEFFKVEYSYDKATWFSDKALFDLRPTISFAETIVEGKPAKLILPSKKFEELAVVDYKVLKELVEWLPSLPIEVIKNSFVSRINATTTYQEYVDIVNSEAAFRSTLQMIKDYEEHKCKIEKEQLKQAEAYKTAV